MGKKNKARRAAKARVRQRDARASAAKARESASHDHPFGNPNTWAPPPPRREAPEFRWLDLEAAAEHDDSSELEKLAARMVRDDPVAGPQAAERLLLDYLDTLWRAGWQPVELVRQVRRRTSKATAGLIEIAIHVDHARRPGQALDPRWSEQLAELGGRRVSTSVGWVSRWGALHGTEEQAVVHVAKTMAVIGRLPMLDVLIPPPGARPDLVVLGVRAESAADDPVLRRVRKLLAKAESTTYGEEADSLTAKAHELVIKHAIDLAALEDPDGAGSREVPGTIRIAIDAPYADAKSLLLQVVAANHRCRSIFHPGIDLSSVIGFPSDLRAVELIFTSLLVQAQHALAGAAGGPRTRSQSYRSAFYLSYANRIGERLRTVSDDVLAAAGEGAHLPVLRAHQDAVDDVFEERHGASVTSGRIRGGYDSLGHAHGRQAADAARFGQDAIRA